MRFDFDRLDHRCVVETVVDELEKTPPQSRGNMHRGGASRPSRFEGIDHPFAIRVGGKLLANLQRNG